jgi:hypothetical protein
LAASWLNAAVYAATWAGSVSSVSSTKVLIATTMSS